MTQEDKELLLKDLCTRLPYGVKASFFDVEKDYISIIEGIDIYKFIKDDSGMESEISDVKPYLFPLSSMTEEQKEEIEDKLIFPSNSNGGWIEILYNDKYNIPFWLIDFCNKNHFDYRGLIEKGLAIDCTNLNIYLLWI